MILDMSSFVECKFSCTPESKTTQPSKVKSAAINKSLLTPCRRIGLAKRSPSIVFESKRAGAEEKHFFRESIKKSDSNPESTPLNTRHKITERRFIGHSKGEHLDEINDFSKDHAAVKGEISIIRESSGNCHVVEQESEVECDIEERCFSNENIISHSDSENKTDHLYTPRKRFKSSARTFIGKCRSEHLGDLGDIRNFTKEKNLSSDLQQSNDLDLNIRVGVLNDNSASILEKHSLEMNTKDYPTGEISQIMPPQEDITKESLEALRLRVRRKQDEVEELKLAQLYKRKHDLKRLIDLTERWCRGCQEALRELRDVSEEKGCQLTIQQLLEKLGIPNHLVRYNNDLEDFE